ncbi:hypothetical protein pb186bvf_003711 [Paramecium bursaria]
MSEESQYSEHSGGWIDWFCSLPQNMFLVEVDEEFVRDCEGIEFKNIETALSMILSPECPDSLDLENDKFIDVYGDAADLYGLIHAQFITTPKGLAIMRERFLNGRFGHCPRVMCEKQNVIPIGMSESLKTARIKIYCPRCQEAYIPRKSQADFDGAYFGRSFPQLLLMSYPDIHPKYTLMLGTPLFLPFQPSLFGFKIHQLPGSKSFQQKQIQHEVSIEVSTEQEKSKENFDPQHEKSVDIKDAVLQNGKKRKNRHKK